MSRVKAGIAMSVSRSHDDQSSTRWRKQPEINNAVSRSVWAEANKGATQMMPERFITCIVLPV